MKSPIIGLTTRTVLKDEAVLPSLTVQMSYINAIIHAGGIPVLIPSVIGEDAWNDLAQSLDGILFTGGGDISLDYFEGENHPAIYGIDPHRDAIEIGLARRASQGQIPFLGICRGIQVVNVALGGTLFTHIPDQVPHAEVHDYPGEDSLTARTALLHSVEIVSGSQFNQITGESVLKVNSLHHQGLKKIASGATPVAYSPDGLVEAIEFRNHPFGIAVQWHPEWLTDQEPTRKLFKAFVDAASKNIHSRDAR